VSPRDRVLRDLLKEQQEQWEMLNAVVTLSERFTTAERALKRIARSGESHLHARVAKRALLKMDHLEAARRERLKRGP
jgi:hypothetical protein